MAKIGEALQKLQALLPADTICEDDAYRSGVAFVAQVSMDKIREVMTLCDDGGWYLESLTAMDFQDTKELVYHMNCYEPKSRFSVRVMLGHAGDALSVCDIYPAAQWKEREIHEFFGIRFDGNSDMRRLLLPDDADEYPLKKDFGKVNAYRRREEIYG